MIAGNEATVRAVTTRAMSEGDHLYLDAVAANVARTIPGVESATPQQINPGGTSYILVTYKGDISQLAAALSARGWVAEAVGTVVKIRSDADKPPALPPPPVQPPATTPPAQPTQATNNTISGEQ